MSVTSRTNRWLRSAYLVITIGLMTTATAVQAETEEARVKTDPWSGYWWPISEGKLLGPLGKYDSAVGRKAAAWERKHNPAGENVPKWFGYCHAWAASSIMENEPVKPIQASGQSFGIGDQKGLLAACHANDVANIYGDRFGDNQGSEDRSDLSPDDFWMLLKRHVREQGVPLIVDIEAGEEVWNYPIFAYKVDYAAVSAGSNRYRGVFSIWMADDAVPVDFVGIKRLLQKYTFEVTMANGSVVMGSGKWIGTSEKDHPDFAWFPYVVRPENPEVVYDSVTKLLSREPSDSSDRSDTGDGIGAESPTLPLMLDPIDLVSLVASRTSDFEMDISVDRFDGGVYREGDLVSVMGKSQKDGYLYLIAIDTQGVPSLLYPQPGDDNRVKGGMPIEIPSPNATYQFRVHQPFGDYRIKAIVSENQLEFSGLTSVQPEPPIRESDFQSPSKTKKKNVALDDQAFRWNPTRRQQVQTLISEYTTKGKVAKDKLNGVDPADILGSFAQDEVVFYVGRNLPPATTSKKDPE